MPYKDKNSPVAIESRRRAMSKWYQKNREYKRQWAKDKYAENPERETERRKKRRNLLSIEQRCVNCGKPRDRGKKTLCSICAPKCSAIVSAYHKRVRDSAFNAYGGYVCVCCGETERIFLTLDHINGDGAAFRKSLRNDKLSSGGGGTRTYLRLKQTGYPPGYRVLCWNCNSAFGMLGYCPHHPRD